ncbi:MAG: TonB-dependent receptor [Verrucomicrobia bacterium]|nr:TonB-dependent receptor [Verrucomicrobiota bacterium]
MAREVTEIEPLFLIAPKLAGSLLRSPLSAIVSDAEFLHSAIVRTTQEAAIYAPSTFFAEASARRMSMPYVRGLGGSGLNPGVTTFIDGVPQLHASSSSLTLLDVAQVDLTRGPLGTLYGRNTLGGGIHLTSRLPSLTTSRGEFQTTVGNYNLWDFRGSVSGPLIQNQLGFSLAGGLSERDGYSQSGSTGEDIDNRSARFGKAQFLWVPDERLEVRLIIAGESDQDGGYAWNSLQALRQRPREVQSDFRGHTSRELIMPTLQAAYHADAFDFVSTTAYVGWDTDEASDLDYSAAPLLQQHNREQMRNWTQEFRLSNPAGELVTLSDELKLGWQAGMLLFHSDYRQNLSNVFPAFPIPLPRASQAELSQVGLGSYIQATLQWKERLTITAGLRWDYEKKEADIRSSSISFISPARMVNQDQLFSQISPQWAVSYQHSPELMSYLSFASGYKAGGFNAIGPVEYDHERSVSYEIGLKGRAWKNKLSFAVAAFYTDWQNLQITQSINPGLTFLQNAGDATSRGLETDLALRLNPRITLFSSASWLQTGFSAKSRQNDRQLGGNDLPYAPDYSLSLGALLNLPLRSGGSLYARVDIQTLGSFHYDVQNTAAQDAYTLANFRMGFRQNTWFAEAFINNAFNTDYIPLAIASQTGGGLVGESGSPLTFGLRCGVYF